MSTLKININDTVRVKLTDNGREILRKNHEDLKRYFPSISDFKIEEKDGWYSSQLWELFQDFGPHISIGKMLPFETEIELDI